MKSTFEEKLKKVNIFVLIWQENFSVYSQSSLNDGVSLRRTRR